MIYARPGADFEAFLKGADPGLVGTLTFRLIDPPAGTVIVAATTAGITEPVDGTYTKTVEAPETKGTYLVVWDTGPDLVTEELVVTSTLPGDGSPDPASIDLTTLARVREFIQEGDLDDDQDEELQRQITAASRAILKRTWKFRPLETAGERTVFLASDGSADLQPHYLRELTGVTISNPDGTSEVELEDDTWRLSPTSGDDPPRFLYPQNRSRRLIVVTGDWGATEIPEDVEQACALTVATWLRRDVAAFSTTFSLDENRLERPEALPSAAWGLIRPYIPLAVPLG